MTVHYPRDGITYMRGQCGANSVSSTTDLAQVTCGKCLELINNAPEGKTMDKVDVLTKLNPDERERYTSFMRTAKGMPTSRFAFAINRLTPGTDWRRCSKSYIAAEWATCERPFGNSRLRHVTLEKLAKAMAEIQKRYT